MTEIICITGMHRSGTSLIANWFQEIGVKLDFGNLIPAKFWNKSGHYEDKLFVEFHSDTIINRYDMSEGWRIFEDSFIKFTKKETEVAKSILAERDDIDCWAWKDPRSILFIPEWLKINSKIVVFVVWRPATEVVLSLMSRSDRAKEETPEYADLLNINFIQSIRLWNVYSQLVISLRKKFPENILLFSVHDIVKKDKAVFTAIQKRIGTPLVYKSISEIFDSSLLGASKTKISLYDYLKLKKLTIRTQYQLRSISSRSEIIGSDRILGAIGRV